MEYSELQQKGLEIARQYEKLPLQIRLGIIAKVFGCERAHIRTSPCRGKWRGTSDVSLVLNNGSSLGMGNYPTPRAKTIKVQNECVNNTLARYNPEIDREIKTRATAALLFREAEDNAIAAEKGLMPYTFLNVELNDGSNDSSSGYLGWYYITLSVDNRIFAFIESGLCHAMAKGMVDEKEGKDEYYVAGGLVEGEEDFVFYNVGFSSLSPLYHLPLNDKARKHAENTLAQRLAPDCITAKTPAT